MRRRANHGMFPVATDRNSYAPADEPAPRANYAMELWTRGKSRPLEETGKEISALPTVNLF